MKKPRHTNGFDDSLDHQLKWISEIGLSLLLCIYIHILRTGAELLEK